eukprot:TRINITY_DN4651_c0_g1_i1.p1 TRINITY_DN4651_c0_g1~~TRINITY_DN4651_c0_g1_i1.p1  ORF type:complete len:132 (-),score=29.34 TRINITY_DN4651_c0_g1_i1:538-933(-)
MDRTACRLHSGGVLPKEEVPGYIENVSEDFKRIIPKLIVAGKQLAIATFTDVLYYQRFPAKGHRAGEDLVKEFLKGVFKNPEIEKKFKVVAYFPDLHEDENHKRNKSYHIEQIMDHYGIKDKKELFCLMTL